MVGIDRPQKEFVCLSRCVQSVALGHLFKMNGGLVFDHRRLVVVKVEEVDNSPEGPLLYRGCKKGAAVLKFVHSSATAEFRFRLVDLSPAVQKCCRMTNACPGKDEVSLSFKEYFGRTFLGPVAVDVCGFSGSERSVDEKMPDSRIFEIRGDSRFVESSTFAVFLKSAGKRDFHRPNGRK